MAIAVRQVTKRFGDFVALDDVSLDIAERLADRPARAERQREVDPAARHRRARAARHGRGLDPRARTSTGVPPQKRGVGFVFQHYAAFKHMTVRDNVALRPEDPQAAEGGDPRPGRRAARPRPARRPRRPLPGPALRRPAPAHGARPRARRRAEGAAARRAVRRARRARAQGAARLAAPPPRRGPRDDRARHARPGGGDGGRRPHRRHERGPRSSRSARRATSTSTRPTSS